MAAFAPTFSSSKARLLRDTHSDMMSNDYPFVTSSVLNDKFLSVVSSQLVKCNNADDRLLRAFSLNILSWILSLISSSDNANESVAQNNFIIQSNHIHISFDRTISLIKSESDDIEVVNLCLFMLMQQSTPELVHGRISAILEAVSSCLYSRNTKLNSYDLSRASLNGSWKSPILACSALCNLMEQQPVEVLSRHLLWSIDVFLLLVDTFTPPSTSSSQHTKVDTVRSDQNSMKNFNAYNGMDKMNGSSSSIGKNINNDNSSDFSTLQSGPRREGGTPLSIYTIHSDSRLLPISVSCLRLLSRIPFHDRLHLLPIAISSSRAAVSEIR